MKLKRIFRAQPILSAARVVALALLATIVAFPASAQDAGVEAEAEPQTALRDSVSVAMIASNSEAATFAQALASALVRNFESAGFRSVELFDGATEDSSTDIKVARGIRKASGTRWVAIARCTIEQRRLVWSAIVFDFLDGSMVAASSQAAFAGLTALPLIDASAAETVAAALALRERKKPGKPIEYRLRFSSRDEGAQVAFGTGDDARQAGLIEGGSLVAPFVAFREGDPVVVSMSKDGYWPRTAVFSPTGADEPIKLPALMPMTRQALSFGVETARLAGVSADYRYYLAPDSIFLRARDLLWLQYAFTAGSVPVIHDELRLGVGAYLFTPHYSRFRFSAGSGLSGIATWILPADATPNLYFDLSLDALWLSFEWHTPAWAVFLEQRVSYSFGSDSGLLRRGWWKSENGPLGLSAGVMFKWP
ncbi:MAG: hypothetical protein CVV51_00080 [Spirochaetae bacterium HGW-Spirochaetae-7]|jgi:hypothetical protein|nr:MAG: hypothetical protein CVV51_00080 [Spirochaetae bacterium HGW-Spirochaetae-7]